MFTESVKTDLITRKPFLLNHLFPPINSHSNVCVSNAAFFLREKSLDGFPSSCMDNHQQNINRSLETHFPCGSMKLQMLSFWLGKQQLAFGSNSANSDLKHNHWWTTLSLQSQGKSVSCYSRKTGFLFSCAWKAEGLNHCLFVPPSIFHNHYCTLHTM